MSLLEQMVFILNILVMNCVKKIKIVNLLISLMMELLLLHVSYTIMVSVNLELKLIQTCMLSQTSGKTH
jgi:hypothetical protein